MAINNRSETLQIKLDVDGEGRVRASLAGVGQGVEQIDDKQQRAASSAKLLSGALAALATTVGTGIIINTIAEYEKLEASLRTVTGSAEAANREFDILKKFAAETPYQVQEVVGSFIKMKALGLDPSIEALRSFGNTAAAMGKNLDQFVEAVADAITGEFERLKEFGIRSSQEGDKVRFTFQGITTEVEKDSAAIQGYLQAIGKTQFAGAMAEQMDTVGGALSNLEDSMSQLFAEIGEAGLSTAIKEAAGVLGDMADGLRDVDKETVILVTSLASARFIGPMFTRISVAAAGMTAQFINSQREAYRLQLALARMNGTSRASASSLLALGAAGRGLRGLLGVLGGPGGIIIGAATALSTWALTSRDAGADTEDLTSRVDALLGKYDELERRRVEETIDEITAAMKREKLAIEEITAAAQAAAPNSPLAGYEQAEIDARVEKIKELSAQYTALNQKLAEMRSGSNNNAPGSTGSDRTDKEQERYERELADLRKHLEDKATLEVEAWWEKQALLDEARAEKDITEEEYRQYTEELEAQHLDRLHKLRVESLQKEMEAEKRVNDTILQMRFNVYRQAAGLLREFAGESQAAAIAVIAIEKGLAIAQTVMNTQVAAMRALAELGPIAGAAAAAKIKTLGAVSVGLIAAQGLAQAANVGGGGASIGSYANPVHTSRVPEQVSPGIREQPAANQQTIFVQLPPDEDRQLSVRQWREMHRELQEANPDARLVYN